MKKERLQAFHRKNIAVAADKLFQEKGMEKTTMDDIARESEYSKATLYVYFKSKNDIYYFIMIRYMRILIDRIQAILDANEDALKQFNLTFAEIVRIYDEFPEYFNSFLSVTVAVDEKSLAENPILKELYMAGEDTNDLYAAIIKNGMAQGVFREDINIYPTIFLFWAAVTNAVQLSNYKEAYIRKRMAMEKAEFLHYCSSSLLRILLKESPDLKQSS